MDELPENKILHGDASTVISDFPDESIQLAVTSPPYNIGVDYGDEVDDDLPIDEWKEMMRNVTEEIFRVLKPDGKFAVNLGASFAKTDNEGRYYRRPLNAFMINIATDIGFDLYDEYVWVKNQFASHGGGALFGSYPYPTNFMANQQHEYILVFRKWVSEDYYSNRVIPEKGTEKREQSKLTKEEWRKYTKSVWDDIRPVSSDELGIEHDAIYPVEVPYRLIRMYSFEGDTVLDPFVGSGTSCVASLRAERNYIGVDVNSEYVETARERVDFDPGEGSEELRQRAMEVHKEAEKDGYEQSDLSDITDE